jgi:Ca2+-binding RTX toxin-like protein
LNGWASLTLAQRSLVKKALDYVESVVDLHFIETQDIQQPNVLVFSNNRQIGSSAYATYPSDNASGSDVFINSTAANLSPNEWSYAALTLMHEIGHALGLKHPFSSAADSIQVSEPPYLSGKEDDSYWTVMSYTQNSYSYGLRYAPLDIAALHYLYGPSQAEKQYDNNFFLNPAGPSFIWDAGGTDCIDGSGLNDNIVLSLNDGDWSWVGRKSDYITDAGQITINIGSLIENAKTGNGNDWTLGNGFSNQLQLGAGNDFADGGAGNDTIDGGADDDLAFYSKATSSYKLYIGINSSLVTDLIGSEGTDTLINIERLAFADKTIRIETKAHGSYGDLPDTLYQFFVVGFGAAAGVTYMDQMAEAYRYWLPQYKDGTVKQIVEVFTTKTQFTSVYPQALYREDEGRYYRYDHDLSQAGKPLVKGAEVSKAVFDTQMANLAQELISIIVKDSASAGAKAQAVSDVRSALGLGGEWTIGKVVYTIFGNLANKPADDPDWAGTAKQFANQVAVSKYYTDTLSQSTDDITTLRSVMAAVTNNTDVSSTEAIASLIGVALLNGPGG